MRSTLVYLQREIETLANHPEVLGDAHRIGVVCEEWIRRIRQALEGTPRVAPIVPSGVCVVADPAGRTLRIVPPGHAIGQSDRWAAILPDGSTAATCQTAPALIRWCRGYDSDTQFLFDLSILEVSRG